VSAGLRRRRGLRHDVIRRPADDDNRPGCWSYVDRCAEDRQFIGVDVGRDDVADHVDVIVDQRHALHRSPNDTTHAPGDLPGRRDPVLDASVGGGSH